MLKPNSILLIFKACLLSYLLQIIIPISSIFAKDDHIIINSENLNINREYDIAIFEGEVILWFEDTIVKTDKVKVKYKNNGEKKSIDNIIIPCKLSAYRASTDEVLIADRAEYTHDEAKLAFYGNVILEHQSRILKTPQLVYYTALKQNNQFDLNK